MHILIQKSIIKYSGYLYFETSVSITPRYYIHSNPMRELMYVLFFYLPKNFSLEARSETLIGREIAVLLEG